nr:agglutinin biogenesis protein MshP [uncultured Roseateles sp.]
MSTTCRKPQHRIVRETGFTLVSVVFILVVLAVLGAAMARMSMRQHLGSAAELGTARAYQAAYAGLEWASVQVLRSAAAPACFAGTQITLGDFVVSVSCTRTQGSDGASTLNFYQLIANACNAPSASGCPNTATSPQTTYLERQLSRTVAR